MFKFTESQIQSMLRQLRDEHGPDIATRELAVLELEDLQRKGCALEFTYRFDECRCCSKAECCPILDWEKRHSEYKDDELAKKIKILEAGGEEAYKEKQKRIEEAKKKKLKMQQKIFSLKKNVYASIAKTGNEDGKPWPKEFDESLEAYVQARLNDKLTIA